MGGSRRADRKFHKVRSGTFQKVYRTGRKAVGRQLILFFLEHEEHFSFAVVASRKIGNAVQRNRAKRLLREAFRDCSPQLDRPGAYLLVARSGMRDQKLSPVLGELTELLTRLDLLSEH